MKRIAIIGGGISGLTAAYRLEQKRTKGVPLEYLLFESSPRFGGVIASERIDDCIVEAGPDSFLSEKARAADLCRELGLGDQLIGSNDAERKTYILINGQLVPLPDGLMFMVPTNFLAAFSSPLFSWITKLRMIREWFYRSHASSDDISVSEFVERHYGREMVDRVADPLLAGVYGGSAEGLSLQSVLPRFADMEAKYGSLGKAMLAQKKHQSASVSPLFTSLRGGMTQLTDALIARIPQSALRANSPAQSLKPDSGKWLVVSNGRTQEFDAAILATPAGRAGELVAEGTPQFAAELSSIRYSSSVTVGLGYDEKVRRALPPGFGFLVPRSEKVRIMAATLVHNKFPQRVPQNRALIRCFLGGTRDPQILDLPEGEIAEIVLQDLAEILGIRADPDFAYVYKWEQAMAQYEVGHRAKIARIQNLLAENPGLALAGNYLGGIGVPDCVRSGSEAAAKIFAELEI